ncbi:MAG: hypothetical protein OK422_06410 [Thaumarchaeota archaeon]|nr:hypothetical protein [Nitrososphaerota archaeon]
MKKLSHLKVGALTFVLIFAILGFVSPSNSVTSPNLLTTTLVPGTPTEKIIGPSLGVLVPYNNTLSTAISVFVYLGVYNKTSGQTVGIPVASDNIPGNGKGAAFIPLNNIPSGNYTGLIFAVTYDGVPVSPTSTISIKV